MGKKSILNLSDFLRENKTKQEIQTTANPSSLIEKLFNKRLTMYKVKNLLIHYHQ